MQLLRECMLLTPFWATCTATSGYIWVHCILDPLLCQTWYEHEDCSITTLMLEVVPLHDIYAFTGFAALCIIWFATQGTLGGAVQAVSMCKGNSQNVCGHNTENTSANADANIGTLSRAEFLTPWQELNARCKWQAQLAHAHHLVTSVIECTFSQWSVLQWRTDSIWQCQQDTVQLQLSKHHPKCLSSRSCL